MFTIAWLPRDLLDRDRDVVGQLRVVAIPFMTVRRNVGPHIFARSSLLATTNMVQHVVRTSHDIIGLVPTSDSLKQQRVLPMSRRVCEADGVHVGRSHEHEFVECTPAVRVT